MPAIDQVLDTSVISVTFKAGSIRPLPATLARHPYRTADANKSNDATVADAPCLSMYMYITWLRSFDARAILGSHMAFPHRDALARLCYPMLVRHGVVSLSRNCVKSCSSTLSRSHVWAACCSSTVGAQVPRKRMWGCKLLGDGEVGWRYREL